MTGLPGQRGAGQRGQGVEVVRVVEVLSILGTRVGLVIASVRGRFLDSSVVYGGGVRRGVRRGGRRRRNLAMRPHAAVVVGYRC